MTNVPTVFLCYASANKQQLERLRDVLLPHERRNEIRIFYDKGIKPGKLWHQRIIQEARRCHVAILLVSIDFLKSDYIHERELPIFLKRWNEGKLTLLPLLASPCTHDQITFKIANGRRSSKEIVLADLQYVGGAAKALSNLTQGEQDHRFVETARQVIQATRGKLHRTNSLGMRFTRIPGIDALFSIWPTRVQDYCMYANSHKTGDQSWRDPEWNGALVTPKPNHPVVQISWHDARAFCKWLTDRELSCRKLRPGDRYRLPLDSEWSIAAGLDEDKAQSIKEKDENKEIIYPWGTQSSPPDRAGNFADQSFKEAFGDGFECIQGYNDGFATTSPVGSFKPLPNGIYDMFGNVWEWCEDAYDARSDDRVLRGGSWGDTCETFVKGNRASHAPYGREVTFGFRVVLETSKSF